MKEADFAQILALGRAQVARPTTQIGALHGFPIYWTGDCLRHRLQDTQRPKNEVKSRCPVLTAGSLFGTLGLGSGLGTSLLLAWT